MFRERNPDLSRVSGDFWYTQLILPAGELYTLCVGVPNSHADVLPYPCSVFHARRLRRDTAAWYDGNCHGFHVASIHACPALSDWLEEQGRLLDADCVRRAYAHYLDHGAGDYYDTAVDCL